MKVILPNIIMIMPTKVTFCCCSIHIADHYFVIICVEVDLCFDLTALQAINYFVHAEMKI